MQSYDHSKKNIGFTIDQPKIITYKQVKNKEAEFNTVLAQYTDNQKVVNGFNIGKQCSTK